MSLAYDTPIAISKDAVKAIQNFSVGDPVWVATGADLRSWADQPVQFSSGTGPGGLNQLVEITFDLKGNPSSLVVTLNQPFLMADKTLKHANQLVPGVDVLVLADFSTTPIISIQVGMFKVGIHHIATSMMPAPSMDGHLLIANGIVAGDYALELSMDREFKE